MPVTTNLLLKLRKALGNEAADELVTWVDQATARELGQIRDLAELHHGRFDAAQRAELIKWMFLFWVGTIVPLAGLMVALLKL